MIEFYGGYQVYSESGVDLTLLPENLRRSLEQRWENNCRGVALARAVTARFLSIDGLIAAKRAAGRRKDRDYVLELEELKKLKDVRPEG